MAIEPRKAVHAYLEDAQHEVWHAVAEEEGISLSGLLEALAMDMKAHPPHEGGHPRWTDLVRAARKIDAQRRRRGGA